MSTIEYRREQTHGRVLLYPITFAKEIEVLTDQKTLNESIMISLTKMGFEFVEVIKWQ